MRVFVRHVLERALWKGSNEAKELESKEFMVKESYLRGIAAKRAVNTKIQPQMSGILWQEDGVAQLQKWVKTE